MKNKINEQEKEFVKSFLEQISQSDESFRMAFREERYAYTRHYLFMQSTIGNGKIIYGCSDTSGDIYSSVKLNLTVAAIVDADGNVYFSEPCFFGLKYWEESEWAELNSESGQTCRWFESWFKTFFASHIDTCLKPFYDSVEAKKDIDEDDDDDCRIGARCTLVYENYVSEYLSDFHFAPPRQEDVIQLLCGNDSPYMKERERYMTSIRDKIALHKARFNCAQEWANKNANMAPWELELAHSLWGLADAANVAATFLLNGQEITVTTHASVLMSKIANNDPFYRDNFYPTKIRYIAMKKCLAMNDGNLPRHTDIIRVAHGKKVIFERNPGHKT